MTFMDKLVTLVGHGLTAFLVLCLVATIIILGAFFTLWALLSNLIN